MAGSSRFTALLDACVLFPATVADALISLRCADFFSARWTARIDEEWIAGVVRTRGIDADRLAVRRDAMHEAAPDWEIAADVYEPLIAGLVLPDDKDRHVLAAAIVGHCDCIVTSNTRDFPPGALRPYGLEAIHPDEFIGLQIDLDPLKAFAAFKRMRARYRNPPRSAEEFAVAFERSGLVATAQRLRDAGELL